MINWSDVNWTAWQNSLGGLPQTNYAGTPVAWTNAIKPLAPIQDVYGEVVKNGIICESAMAAAYPDKDVREFMDYLAADPNAVTAGGYRGANFWRTDTIGTNQWANIIGSTGGNYSNIVNNVVLDNPAATVTGAWTAARVFGASATSPTYYGATGSDTNCFGTNYLFKTHGTGAAFVQFTPGILIAGDYDVFQWHPFLTNASAATPFQVLGATGTNLVFANQQTNAGDWSWLGRFDFATGGSNFIRVLDSFSDASNVAVADGVKLVYANSDVILDNTNALVTFAGSWSTGAVAGDYAAGYRYAASAATVTATATFRPSFPNPGLYDVFIWHPPGSGSATNAPWTISCWGGITNISVNEQVNSGAWFQIAAACPFSAGTNGFVQLANNAASGSVVADAVRFAFAGPLAPLSIGAIDREGDGRIKLTVNSTPGYGLWLDHATNLPAWHPLTNLLNADGQLIFTDNFTITNSAGYYRARQ